MSDGNESAATLASTTVLGNLIAEREGWLVKRGHVRKNWKRRYFILNRHHLYYFSSQSSSGKPKGVVTLDGYMVRRASPAEGASVLQRFNRDEPCLLILDGAGNPQRPNFCLLCDDELEMMQWINSIKLSVARMNNIKANDLASRPSSTSTGGVRRMNASCARCSEKLKGKVVQVGDLLLHYECFSCTDCGCQLEGACITVKNQSYCDACGPRAFHREQAHQGAANDGDGEDEGAVGKVTRAMSDLMGDGERRVSLSGGGGDDSVFYEADDDESGGIASGESGRSQSYSETPGTSVTPSASPTRAAATPSISTTFVSGEQAPVAGTQPPTKKTAKDKLLVWCSLMTQRYEDVTIRDFSESWRDGRALCALLHRFVPDLIAFDSTAEDDVDCDDPAASRARALFLRAFHTAESIGIRTILDIDDLARAAPDPQLMTLYLADVYRVFKSRSLK